MSPAVRWVALFSYCALIFYLSSQSLHVPAPFRFSDKLIHLIEYFVLGALAVGAFESIQGKGNFRKLIFWAWLFAALYGVSDEFHQSFVPHRDASGWDALADALGAFMGVRLAAAFLDRGSQQKVS